MKKYYEDNNYLNYINDILNHDEFKKLETITHHGNNRLEHSIRVSYYSYRLAKLFELEKEKVARAALLHDFFFEDNQAISKKERFNVLLNHPEYACINAKRYFSLSTLEEDIITSHMFPIGKKIPKYAESWLVDIVDDVASIYEKVHVLFRQLSTAMSFLLVFLINNL